MDDILIVSHDPTKYMAQLQDSYYVKPNSIKFPDLYLGAQVKKVMDRCGQPAFATSSNKYVQEAVVVIEQRMKDLNLAYTKAAKSPKNPFSNTKYRPELDVTEFCTEPLHQFYQQVIGIQRWMIEIGRIDISTEVSLLSRYLSQPRNGHLHQALHMVSYLKNNECMELCYDPTKINIQEHTILPSERAQAKANVMRLMYPDAIDYLPPN